MDIRDTHGASSGGKLLFVVGPLVGSEYDLCASTL